MPKPKQKPQLISKKTYTIIQRMYSDGAQTVERRNEGFYANELFGHLKLAEREILDQLDGKLNPEDVRKERKLIKKQ